MAKSLSNEGRRLLHAAVAQSEKRAKPVTLACVTYAPELLPGPDDPDDVEVIAGNDIVFSRHKALP